MSNTKQISKHEALEKIKLLTSHIESLPSSKHPKYKMGQVYRHIERNIFFMLAPRFEDRGDEFFLTCVHNGYPGRRWSKNGFDGDNDLFEYVGMFDDLFSFRGISTNEKPNSSMGG